MPAEGDLAKAKVSDPDMSFPDKVQLRLVWIVEGRARIRSLEISADQFFGRGQYGAPIPAEALVQHIDRMRKSGAPEVPARPSRKARR